MYAMLVLVLALGGCASAKATFIEGGDKSMAVVEIGMMGGKIVINGPFKYCSEPAVMGGDNATAVPDSVCASLLYPVKDSDEKEVSE